MVALVVLLGLLVVADRAGAAYAARVVAEEVQRAAGLDARPDVDVGGFPFLTQAVAGRYERIDVRATDVPADDLVIAVLEASLDGVRAPLSDVLSQSLAEVPVDRVTARALLSYDVLAERYGTEGLVIEPDGDRLRITGELSIADQTLSAVATSRVEVQDGELLLSADEVGLQDETSDSDSLSALSEALELRLPVEGLPYDLAVTAAEVRPDGVALDAEADDVVLQPR